ncbi:hypothetical protein ACFRQM_21405 [Streptomyces sp. NPDC056831]|uniref:hypothetical protein n=1 Tax=Streptomyces sp. NPDC056831 TaxID=3345954 RepID=UPI00367730C2
MPFAPGLGPCARLEARRPTEEARRTLANDVRAAVPEHAERILGDPGWPALATVLAYAEAGGHKPHQLRANGQQSSGGHQKAVVQAKPLQAGGQILRAECH